MDNNLFFAFQDKMSSAFPAFYSEDEYEKIGVTLCLIPTFQPDLLDNFIKKEFGVEGDYPLIGGIRGTNHRGIMPTGETWMYFCCKNFTASRINFIQNIHDYLENEKAFLNIESHLPDEPFLSGRLTFSKYFRQLFQAESILYEPPFSDLKLGNFIHTNLILNDLVLDQEIENCVEEIKHWQYFNENSNSNSPFFSRVKPGMKMLFYGKSGTGKTQTAAIIANDLGKKIYRIDLSQIVSKYIGETEKNLSKIFEVAEHKGWILFFDEGDALFAKRTAVSSANDRYANQEVAYLLQRIEDYSGIIIISTNLKENIDAAFLRRFNNIVEFPMPDTQQRNAIWQKILSELVDNQIDINSEEWDEIAKIELSGGAITNIINYVMLKSNFTKTPINYSLVKLGIIRELRKENRLTSL